MVHSNLRGIVAALSLAAVVAGAPLLMGRAQEAAPLAPAPQPETLEQRVARLEELVTWQEQEIDRLARLTDGLVLGAQRLSVAADVALEWGFVEAGANPAAKEALLAGIHGFNDAVQESAEPPKDRRDCEDCGGDDGGCDACGDGAEECCDDDPGDLR